MILITGATGSNGLELVHRLVSKKVPLRAMVRNPAKATELTLPGVELIQGDFSDKASLSAALKGIDRAFLLAPAVENIDRVERVFIDAAKSAGVRHIVNLSAVGAGVVCAGVAAGSGGDAGGNAAFDDGAGLVVQLRRGMDAGAAGG